MKNRRDGGGRVGVEHTGCKRETQKVRDRKGDIGEIREKRCERKKINRRDTEREDKAFRDSHII